MNILTSDSAPSEYYGRNLYWLLTWTLATTLFLTFLFVCETGWRSLGYHPSAVDSPALWRFWYDRAVSGGPRTIVMIGTSRIQGDICTAVLRDRLPHYRVVQLAKYASGSPIGVLRALASDDRFNGIVICDTIEPFLISRYWDDQRELFEYDGSISIRLDALISATVLEHLAIRSSESGIWAATSELVNHSSLPFARHIRMRSDRCLEFDFSGVQDLAKLREEKQAMYRRRYASANFPSPEELDSDIEQIEEFVRTIRVRGGQVVFVRMPSSGKRLELEEEYHPKNMYWDRFAAKSSGIHIHSAELPDADGWAAPDDSHLDYRDAIRFTDALVDNLIQRQVVEVR